METLVHLTPHFTVGELACSHCGRSDVTHELLRVLEATRVAYARPIIVVSGYRCPEHEKRVSGAEVETPHQGWAVDVRAPVGRDLYDLIRAALASGFLGFGMGMPAGVKHLHFDVYAKLGPRAWMY